MFQQVRKKFPDWIFAVGSLIRFTRGHSMSATKSCRKLIRFAGRVRLEVMKFLLHARNNDTYKADVLFENLKTHFFGILCMCISCFIHYEWFETNTNISSS